MKALFILIITATLASCIVVTPTRRGYGCMRNVNHFQPIKFQHKR